MILTWRDKILHLVVIGGSGFLGQRIVQTARSRGDRVMVLGRKDCNLYDLSSLVQTLETIAPDALINAAGYSGRPNVDACEMNKAECLAANAVLPGIIGLACHQIGLPWGHISSGCIFNKTETPQRSFSELDEPNFTFRQGPCSFYSGTKALGEEVLQDASQCYIWRIRIPFSNRDSERNYLSKLIRYDRLLEATNSISEVNEFVSAVLDCFVMRVPFGTYHLTNPGAVSTTEVVQMIRESGIADKDFRFFNSEEEFMQAAAITPRSNCILNCQKALQAGLKLSPIREAIVRALHSWIPENQALYQRAA